MEVEKNSIHFIGSLAANLDFKLVNKGIDDKGTDYLRWRRWLRHMASRFVFWHKKASAGFPRRADNHARPVSLPKWPHPLAGTTLPRFGRLARASAPLLMRLQDKIFI